jgi:hypothetical protein
VKSREPKSVAKSMAFGVFVKNEKYLIKRGKPGRWAG